MERFVDLHIHTTASDGTLAPRQVVELARSLDLAAIAVTDHDTAAGLDEARTAGAELGVPVIPGVELAARYAGVSVHILGLFIDPAADSLVRAAEQAVRARLERNGKIVAAMAADGLPITMEALAAAHPGAVLGRPHIAQWLADNGYAADARDGFDRFLGRGRPYYRPREHLTLAQAAEAIRGAGGVAVIAHPFQYGFDQAALDRYVRDAAAAGCRAIEAYYAEHTPAQQAAAIDLAGRYGLALSGGSDFHGAVKPHIHMGSGIDGSLAVPASVLDGLRRQL